MTEHESMVDRGYPTVRIILEGPIALCYHAAPTNHWCLIMSTAADDSIVVVTKDQLIEVFPTAFVGGDAEGIAELVTADYIFHYP